MWENSKHQLQYHRQLVQLSTVTLRSLTQGLSKEFSTAKPAKQQNWLGSTILSFSSVLHNKFWWNYLCCEKSELSKSKGLVIPIVWHKLMGTDDYSTIRSTNGTESLETTWTWLLNLPAHQIFYCFLTWLPRWGKSPPFSITSTPTEFLFSKWLLREIVSTTSRFCSKKFSWFTQSSYIAQAIENSPSGKELNPN